MDMLATEQLVLLLTDDTTGKTPASVYSWRDYAMAGGLLLDLWLAGAVAPEDKRGALHTPKVLVLPGVSVTDPLLAEALDVVSQKPRTAQSLVQRLGSRTYAKATRRLAERGILREERAKVLGIFPQTRWPALDPAPESRVRVELEDALLRGMTPQPRTAGLVALLLAIHQVHKVVQDPGVSSRQVKARAKELARGHWPADAVKRAVDAATAAASS